MAGRDPAVIAGAIRERLNASKRALASTKLVVVLLGPGGDFANPSADLKKRLRIRQHLSDKFEHDDVIIPEQHLTDEDLDELGIWNAERPILEMADIVLALIPPEARIGGVFGELRDLSDDSDLMVKTWIFRPDDRLSSGRRGYPERRAYERIDESRFIDYQVSEWDSCNFIRKMSAGRLDAVRRRKAERSRMSMA